MPEQEDKELRRRGIWSRTVTFGLVGIPVAILPAQRPKRVRMRMLAPDGTPLARRFYCPMEGRPVERDEIIRGYEIEKGKFVTVTEEELESLQPEKSREIDLRRFVPAHQIDPKFVDRAYFMLPMGDSRKPYRLLAETMEKTGKAGIATFVMRGKEYLVAIMARNGILMAETLRFEDELRAPESTGVNEDEKEKSIVPDRVEAMTREIRAATADDIDMGELEDEHANRLLELASRKRKAGKDLVRLTEPEKSQAEPENVVDLMRVLKEMMENDSGSASDKDLENLSKPELYHKAKALNIHRRSAMNRDELIDAIRDNA